MEGTMANGNGGFRRRALEFTTDLMDRVAQGLGGQPRMGPRKPKAKPKARPARSGHRNINKQLEKLEKEGLI